MASTAGTQSSCSARISTRVQPLGQRCHCREAERQSRLNRIRDIRGDSAYVSLVWLRRSSGVVDGDVDLGAVAGREIAEGGVLVTSGVFAASS